jgi:hypothetical protein
LFVLVTALCCWLGWESRVVQQRRALLSELKTKPAFQFMSAKTFQEITKLNPPWAPTPPVAKIPLTRRLLGDEAIQRVIYARFYQGYSDDDLARIQKVFPEAETLESLPEPCHPGCFPRGTLVDTPNGALPIETLQAGDVVCAFDKTGRPFTATIESVFRVENFLWEVQTRAGSLITTETQPVCLAGFEIQAAGLLTPGQQLLRRHESRLLSVEVLDVARTGRFAPVYNLVLGGSSFFVANGYLVRSKPPAAVATQ